MTAPDYNVCVKNADGKHAPIVQDFDPEIGNTHVSVMCGACGTTTGYPIAAFADDLEWN